MRLSAYVINKLYPPKYFGGQGSGNWGHAGRVGERGGSLAGSSYKHGRFEGLTMRDEKELITLVDHPVDPPPPPPKEIPKTRVYVGGSTGRRMRINFTSVPTPEQVKDMEDAVNLIPSKYRTGMKVKVYTGKQALYKFKADDGRTYNAVGDYTYNTTRLRLAGAYKGLRSVMVHEVGHHVWKEHMSAPQRMKWNMLWIEHKNRMPTDYAKTNSHEGFAESFMYYHHGSQNDRSIDAPRPWKDFKLRQNVWLNFMHEERI